MDVWIEYFRKKLNINVLRNDNHILESHSHGNTKISTNSSKICIVGVDDLVTEKLKIPGKFFFELRNFKQIFKLILKI